MKDLLVRTTCLLSLIFVPVTGSPHHNVANRYDASQTVEIEGVVTEAIWRNPHVQISILATNENGEEEFWDMATTALSNIRRWQIEPEFIEVGDQVRVAGHPARRGVGMYISHVLTPEGEEVLLDPNAESRWSDQIIGIAESRRALTGDSTAPELGIFRVWSHPEGVGMLFPEDVNPNFDLENYPLNDAARDVIASFVRERDNPIAFCQPKGMPTIMEAPYPHRFIEDGQYIIWHQEEYDTVRYINMAPEATAEGKPRSKYGYSIGHWEEDNTLVVTTTNTTWRWMDTAGVPLSEDVEIVERFTVSDDGGRLDFEMTITDPAYFTQPVSVSKFWLYFEDAEVGIYACTPIAED